MSIPFLNGMFGEPLPYQFHSDWIITSVLYLCILLSSLSFAKEKKYLLQQLKDFWFYKERSSLFDEVTTSDIRYLFLLRFQTCLLLGLCFYFYYADCNPAMIEKIPHGLLLAGFTLSIVGFVFLKSIFYCFINWIFFQKVRNSIWITSFLNLIIWLGILLLPVVLVTVYFNISTKIGLFLAISVIIIAKIALFWKCFCNFFEKIHGSFHLILYFCALEILPELLLWKGMELLSNKLI